MLESGIIVFLTFWLLWMKLGVVTRLRALNHPLLLDIAVTVTVFMLYGGSADGVMAASFAAVIMSISISSARKWFGYIRKDGDEFIYRVGKWNMESKINAELASAR